MEKKSPRQRSSGTLCLTFDDRTFASWEKALPLFSRYNAHVTFFVSGEIDAAVLEFMEKVQAAGHSVGLHALNHAIAVDYMKEHGYGAYTADEVMPQLEICRKHGIKIRSFAYPCSNFLPETNKELFENFDFLRTNCKTILSPGGSPAETDGFFNRAIGEKHLFCGFPASGRFDADMLKKAMKRAAAENAVIVFYAHDITSEIAPSHHIAFAQLEDLLEYAASIGLACCGMNEL